MNDNDAREFTLTAKVDDISWGSIHEDYVEIEDDYDYILEEDREIVNKHIERLQKRIRELKNEVSHLRGANETWEKMWRIWNS